jgi:orotate phosphoribosyltransferase
LTHCPINSLEEKAKEITISLYEHGMIRTWYRHKPSGWFLVSGMWSPFYIQLRTLSSYPRILRDIGETLSQLIGDQIPQATRIVGIAMSGIPIAVAASLSCNLPAAFTRKAEIRSHLGQNKAAYGEHSNIEGEIRENDNIVLVDDVVTRFDTKLQALSQISDEVSARGLKNVNCRYIAVVIDREQGGAVSAEKAHVNLLSLIKFRSNALEWLSPLMASVEREVICEYLANPDKFQDPKIIEELKREAEKRLLPEGISVS